MIAAVVVTCVFIVLSALLAVALPHHLPDESPALHRARTTPMPDRSGWDQS